MFSGSKFLRSLLPIASIAVIAFSGSLSHAQDDSMGLPPRTEAPPASAQQPAGNAISPVQSSEEQGRFVFKKQVQEVVLHATVVDEAGRLVTSLGRNDFTAFQNGLPEAITSFRREDVPVAIG